MDIKNERSGKIWTNNLFGARIGALSVICVMLLNTTSAIASAAAPARTPPASVLAMTARQVGSALTARIEITSPAAYLPPEVTVRVNGKEIGSKFISGSCGGAPCLAATVTSYDGLHAGKNVVGALAKLQDGRRASGRIRFDLTTTSTSNSGAAIKLTARPQMNTLGMQVAGPALAQSVSASVASPFLPPTIAFNTNYAGGYQSGSPWLTVGQTQYPTTTPSCSGTAVFTAIIFDRATLAEKKSDPEDSPKCLSSSTELNTWLASLPSGDLVILGTNYGSNPSPPFDTSLIGGTSYAATSKLNGYMIIGATGATPGTAFESYSSQNGTFGAPSAYGILQEDAAGNYNYLPGEVIRYVVMPNAPAGAFHYGPATSAIQLSATAQQLNDAPSAAYRSYAPPAGTDGFWLLTLNRQTLEPIADCQVPDVIRGNVSFSNGCGTFYQTNSSTHGPAQSQSDYAALATALAAANKDPWQLVFLTTIGNATCCDWKSAVAAAGSIVNFTTSLTALGGTPSLTTYPETGWNTTLTPAYSLVTAASLGNALSGPVAESSTVLLNDHGQTGTIMGTLQRTNTAGVFTPGDVNQVYPQMLIDNGGLDNQFTTSTVALQQPVTWPALDQSNLLAGADSIAGQINAYRFISYSLLTNKYMVGASGSHLDDLHYFFTGSTATNIDYHYFDPIDLPWPGNTGAGFTACSSITPGTNGDDTCNYAFSSADMVSFTVNDFMAVKNQTSKEVQDLTNVLVYFLTGSTNLKDVLIGGNASVGVALTGAASTILGSKLGAQAATTSVNISWESILGMMNGVLTIGAGVPGLLDLAEPLEDLAKVAPKTVQALKYSGAVSNEIAGAAGLASGAGGISTSSTTTPLPSKYAKFSQTIGQLANGALQDQLNSGFDAVVDSITSDWGRIKLIAPRVVNSDDPAFFSPRQDAQTIAIGAATKSASRQFYLGLMPTLYQVHYWHGVGEDTYLDPTTNIKSNQPDMGYGSEHNCGETSTAFYLQSDGKGSFLPVAPYVSIAAATVDGSTDFTQDMGGIDYYVIASAPSNIGASNESIAVMDTQLAQSLFATSGLALPMQQFVTSNGPMASAWHDAGKTNDVIGKMSDSSINSGFTTTCNPTSGQIGSGTSPIPGVSNTTTTLTAPSAATIGSSVTLTATVKTAAGTLAPAGMIYFMEDGTMVATVPLTNGSASTSVSNLALGVHTVAASYPAEDAYAPSDSGTQPLTVYANDPTFSIKTSQTTLTANTGAGSVSSPINVSVTSSYGASGNVSFACSGLPVGMTCNFKPAQASLADGGTAGTVMTISSTAAGSASLLGFGLLLPMGFRLRRSRRVITFMSAGAVALVLLSGCGGDQTNYQRPATGTVTVLVSATLGAVTQSTPVQVTLQ